MSTVPGTTDPQLEVAKVALSVARESVVEQHADVRELRSYAAALLTAMALVVSFLGGRALDAPDQDYRWLVLVGFLLFVLSLGLLMTVLIPALYFSEDGIVEIARGSFLLEEEAALDTDRPDLDAYTRLTATYDKIYEFNSNPKKRLTKRLGWAALLLLLQVAAWGASIELVRRAEASVCCAAPDSAPRGPRTPDTVAERQRCGLAFASASSPIARVPPGALR